MLQKMTLLFAMLLMLAVFPACAQEEQAPEGAPEAPAAQDQEVDKKVIADPAHEKMNQEAPAKYQALFHTTAGDFVVDVHRDWAPHGADRFYNLVVNGYYNENRFFRVVPGFVVQWGMHGDPAINRAWRASRAARIPDDRVKQSNTRGRVVFATSGPNSRTTQLFINFGNNARLDGMGFAPFGEISKGMEVVDKLNSQYGENPNQGLIHERGNEYLDASFPKLDHIITATIVKNEEQAEEGADDAPEGNDAE